MKKCVKFAPAAAAAAGLLSGCITAPPLAQVAAPPEIQAFYTPDDLVVDGRLDEAIWKRAPAYALTLPADRTAAGEVLQEAGTVRFAWNERHLYLAVSFDDADVVAEGEEDGEPHFAKGDVAELFLWPEPHPWYWELYATPHNRQSSYFFPSPGRMLPSCFKNHLQLKVAAQIQGTLNDWSDRDAGWTAEMAVPVAELTRRGEVWGPDAVWRVLVGRYNYSVYLPKPELSATPLLSKTSYHLRNEYARLKLLP